MKSHEQIAQIAHNFTVGGIASGGVGGVMLFVEKHPALVSQGLVFMSVLVGAIGLGVNWYYRHLENGRKQEVHDMDILERRKVMGLADEATD